jgi:hypothetical protein
VKTAKAFDCVRSKDHIQARLLKQWRGLSREEIRSQIRQDLATSDSDMAKWWRAIERSPAKRPR